MTDQNQKKQGSGIHPVTAAVAGVVVGATAAVIAGAAVLANDDSRKKVEKSIDKAKDNVANMKTAVEEKITEGKEKVNEVAAAIEDSTQNTAQ